MYLTYDEYRRMGGTLDEVPFEEFEFQAEAQINHATFSRLKGDKIIPNEVKRLTHYLIDLLEKKSAAFSLGNGGTGNGAYITSQSNDGVSISYNGMAPSDLVELCKAEVLIVIRSYLDGVTNEAGRKLLYRGIYPGE
jgi:hypothetical protein